MATRQILVISDDYFERFQNTVKTHNEQHPENPVHLHQAYLKNWDNFFAYSIQLANLCEAKEIPFTIFDDE